MERAIRAIPDDKIFQYPLSDRGLCNLSRPMPAVLTLSPFSILSRIVDSVTRERINCPFGTNDFQYPLSDRGLCNIAPTLPPIGTEDLSVSSLGSWTL